MRLPTKPGHTPDQRGDLADLLRELHRRGDDRLGRLLRAHDLQQAHHVRGREEVQADDRVGALRDARDLVDVQARSVGGEDRALLDDAVELAEHLLLDVHVLEHGFDHQVAVRQRFELQRAAQQAHALLDVLGLELAALRGGLVVLADHAEAAIERVLLRFDQRHRHADVREVHRDAAAHRAGADDADLLDRDRRSVLRHVRHFPHLALGEEHVALRRRLRAGHQLHEQLALGRDALIERQVHGRLDAADVVFGREEAAELARIGLAEFGEELRLAARGFDLLVHVAHFAAAAASRR